MKTLLFGIGVLVPALAWAAPPAAPVRPGATSCIACHGDPASFDAAERAVVDTFRVDVHAGVGLSCQDCHGGNPDPALSDDADAAMSATFAANPFRGAPARKDIPHFCGRCHSDAVFMKRFKPDPRIDQETEYATSFHGRGLARGDARVATCVDCHGSHGILPPTDARSPVYPTHVAETCRRCHADPARMKGSFLPDGRPLPVDQYDRWRRSVHATALLERGDLSAPTCNDCHGNHGATPPGVEGVAFVCGQCHGREADLFRGSRKHAGFVKHDALMTESGSTACGDCHGAGEPQSNVKNVHGFTECAICHDNHAVIRPTMALLGGLPETPCAFCHEGPSPPAEEANEPERIRRHYIQLRDALLAQAETLGLVGTDRFDWLVDRVQQLPTHTLSSTDRDSTKLELRPEFARLFQKFRIGKTTYSYHDPALGKDVVASVRTCTVCHGEKPELAEEPVGFETSRKYLRDMEDLTALTARAERTLLAARRGGVEVRGSLSDLDQAVNSQIELEVLVHGFDADSTGAFAKKHAEGMHYAAAALSGGRSGLREIAHRRRGLGVSLVFIALTLTGIGLKIRAVSRDTRETIS
jgi:hypothetical protein